MSKATDFLEASNNTRWGFYATIKKAFSLNDVQTSSVWNYATKALLSKIKNASQEAVEEFLDSSLGRQLADEVTNYKSPNLDQGITAAKAAFGNWNDSKDSNWVVKAYYKSAGR